MSLALDGTNGITYPATTTVQNAAIGAWVNFNGNGGATIRASYNVTSVTRVSAGTYTITFTNAFPDTNYAIAWTGDNTGGINVDYSGVTARTTSSVAVRQYNTSSTAVDATWANLIVVR
jgi:hypothetical protein